MLRREDELQEGRELEDGNFEELIEFRKTQQTTGQSTHKLPELDHFEGI